MDGEITEQQLQIERMGEMELQKLHLHYINECMKHDLWKDISHTREYKMRDILFTEMKIRMNAQ